MAIQWRVEPGGYNLRDEAPAKRSRTVKITAVADSVLYDPMPVIDAVGIRLGAPWQMDGEYDGTVSCTRIEATPDRQQPRVWSITYEYQSRTPDEGKEGQGDPSQWGNPNPIDRPPRLEFALAPRSEPVEFGYLVGLSYWNAAAGKRQEIEYQPTWGPLVNSAGQRIDKPPTRAITRWEMTYTRNERKFPWGKSGKFLDVCNADKFLGVAPGLWLCQGITGSWVFERVEDKAYGYWAVTYKFLYDARGHDIWILDEGTVENKNVGGQYQIVRGVDENGLPRGRWPLNGHGEFLKEIGRAHV